MRKTIRSSVRSSQNGSGSITHSLTKDVPVEVIGDRMNVTRDGLDKHYDERSEEVKLE